MGERRKKTSLQQSGYNELPTIEDTNSTLDNEYEQSSDLFRLVNKTNKSVQATPHRNVKTRQFLPKPTLPKSNPASLAKDKTVCSEEELKEIQKKDDEKDRKRKSPSKPSYSAQLNLNKPYLKSATDFKYERKKKS